MWNLLIFWSRRRGSAPRGRASSFDYPRTFSNFFLSLSSREPTAIRVSRNRPQRQKNTAQPQGYTVFLVEATGIAPLAARPTPTFLTSSFSTKSPLSQSYVWQSVLLPQNSSYPRSPSHVAKSKNSRNTCGDTAVLVEATGIEPTTSASRTLRATSCATPRFSIFLYFPFKETRIL